MATGKHPSGRPKSRGKIGGSRNVLTVTGADPTKVQRIVNDTGDRINQMIDAGWEIVTDSNISVGDRRVANPTKEGSPVRVSVGGGQQAYVMQIRRDWYEENQAEKAAHVTELEQGMKQEAKQAADFGKLSVE